MARKKSALKKLKKGFSKKKKQEESRIANRDFKLDPGQVYANMNEMLEKDEDNERPKYKTPSQEEERDMFENIEEAITSGRNCGRRKALEISAQVGWRKGKRQLISEHPPRSRKRLPSWKERRL